MFFVTALLFEFEIGVTAIALGVFAAALVVSLLIRNVRKTRFLPAIFASAAVACVLLICETVFVYNPAMEYAGKDNCLIRAEITDLPELKYGNYYYEANILEINGEKTDIDVRLSSSTAIEATPYDIVEGNFNIYALGSSDESFFQSYKSKGLFLGAYSSDNAYSVFQVDTDEKPFMYKIIELREGIKKAIFKIMPDDNGALAVALILGDKSNLSDEIYSDFTELGISHVICVSGFHLSLWAMLILSVLNKTRLNFRICNILAACGVVLFMLIAGFTYSVMRAGIMMLVFLIGNIFLRQRDSLNSLGIAVSVLAVFKPFSMGAVSLQLSVLATAGIILYTLYLEPEISCALSGIKNKFLNKVSGKVVSAFMITFSATAFTMPVGLVMRNSFNFLCFPANMVAVPLSGASMVTGALGALLGQFVPVGYNLPSAVAKLLCRILIDFTSWLSEFKFATFGISTDKTAVLFCGIFLFCLLTVSVSVLKKKVYTIGAAVFAFIFSVCLISLSIAESDETKITVVDCGNGTSVLVSCNGENILVGAGGSDFLGASDITGLIEKAGGRLNAAFIPDADDSASAYLSDVFREVIPDVVCSGKLPDGLDLLLQQTEKRSFTENYSTENISVKSYNIENNYCSHIETYDISAVICFDPSFDYGALPDEMKAADIIIFRGNFPFGVFECTDSFYILNAEEERAVNVQESFNISGNRFVSTGGNGNIIIRALNGDFKSERG